MKKDTIYQQIKQVASAVSPPCVSLLLDDDLYRCTCSYSLSPEPYYLLYYIEDLPSAGFFSSKHEIDGCINCAPWWFSTMNSKYSCRKCLKFKQLPTEYVQNSKYTNKRVHHVRKCFGATLATVMANKFILFQLCCCVYHIASVCESKCTSRLTSTPFSFSSPLSQVGSEIHLF